MLDDGRVYAAKTFYRLNDGAQGSPSNEENLLALKQELVVMTIAQSICGDFVAYAHSLQVGIAGMLFYPLNFDVC